LDEGIVLPYAPPTRRGPTANIAERPNKRPKIVHLTISTSSDEGEDEDEDYRDGDNNDEQDGHSADSEHGNATERARVSATWMSTPARRAEMWKELRATVADILLLKPSYSALLNEGVVPLQLLVATFDTQNRAHACHVRDWCSLRDILFHPGLARGKDSMFRLSVINKVICTPMAHAARVLYYIADADTFADVMATFEHEIGAHARAMARRITLCHTSMRRLASAGPQRILSALAEGFVVPAYRGMPCADVDGVDVRRAEYRCALSAVLQRHSSSSNKRARSRPQQSLPQDVPTPRPCVARCEKRITRAAAERTTHVTSGRRPEQTQPTCLPPPPPPTTTSTAVAAATTATSTGYDADVAPEPRAPPRPGSQDEPKLGPPLLLAPGRTTSLLGHALLRLRHYADEMGSTTTPHLVYSPGLVAQHLLDKLDDLLALSTHAEHAPNRDLLKIVALAWHVSEVSGGAHTPSYYVLHLLEEALQMPQDRAILSTALWLTQRVVGDVPMGPECGERAIMDAVALTCVDLACSYPLVYECVFDGPEQRKRGHAARVRALDTMRSVTIMCTEHRARLAQRLASLELFHTSLGNAPHVTPADKGVVVLPRLIAALSDPPSPTPASATTLSTATAP
jgi:hypothetical protein